MTKELKVLDERSKLIYPEGCDLYRDWEVASDNVTLKAFSSEASHDATSFYEKLLAHVDLRLDWYVPSIDCIKFFTFITIVAGKQLENNNSIAQMFFIDCIFSQPNVRPYFNARGVDFDQVKGDFIAVCCREFAKTSLISSLIMYVAFLGSMPGFGSIGTAIYLSESMNNNVAIVMQKLKDMYDNSPLLQSWFVKVRITSKSASFIRVLDNDTIRQINAVGINPDSIIKTLSDKVVSTDTGEFKSDEESPYEYFTTSSDTSFTILGKSVETSVRGASSANFRPTWAIIDDIVSSSSKANSAAELAHIDNVIDQDLAGGMHGSRSKTTFLGTPYHSNDPLVKRVNLKIFLTVVLPKAAKPPYPGMTKEEFEGVWEERHTFDVCQSKLAKALKAKEGGANGMLRGLLQEHYLQTTAEDYKMLTREAIKFYDKAYFDRNKHNFNFLILTDLTASIEVRDKTDFTGIAVVAVDKHDNKFFYRLTLKKLSIEEQYEQLYKYVQELNSMSKVPSIAIEMDGQQSLNLFNLRKNFQSKQLLVSFAKQKGVKGYKPGIFSKRMGSKLERFMHVMPEFENNRIFYNPELQNTPDFLELTDELLSVTSGGITSLHDDGIDTTSQLALIKYTIPDYVEGSSSNNLITVDNLDLVINHYL